MVNEFNLELAEHRVSDSDSLDLEAPDNKKTESLNHSQGSDPNSNHDEFSFNGPTAAPVISQS
jgi:hypothetical protein